MATVMLKHVCKTWRTQASLAEADHFRNIAQYGQYALMNEG